MASNVVSAPNAPGHKGGHGRGGVIVWGAVVLLLSAALLTSAFAAGFAAVQADETVVAWAAKQVLLGRTPYRDFFVFQPPLLVYGVAGFYAVAGATLGTLRLLSIAWLAGAAIVLYVLVLRQAVPARWAAATALVLPAVVVPFWPISSHHWFAMGFGLAALAAVSGDRPRSRSWLAAGVLAALAGLCVQTAGVVFATLVGTRLLVSPGGPTGRHLAALAAGLALPIAGALGVLAAQGALREGFELVVLWPLKFYKQPGGFNDLQNYTAASGVARITPTAAVVNPMMGSAMLLLALLAALLVRGFRAPAGAPRLHWRRWVAGLAGGVAIAGVLLMGRRDWTHLVLALPPLLYVAFSVVQWAEDPVARRTLQAALVIALLVAGSRWAVHWTRQPPSLEAVVAVDELFRTTSVPSVLQELPEGPATSPPLVYLSHGGSGLYLFHAPDPPPVDWLLPPSHQTNSPREFEQMARFVATRRVPYVLIPAHHAERFLSEASPLGDVLRTQYTPAGTTGWGLLLRRIDRAMIADGSEAS